MRFSKEYSKLKLNEFTTIRKDTGFYYAGKTITINRPSGSFKVLILKTEPITKADITENLAESDADCSRLELIAMLEKWYGRKYNKYILIYMKRIQEDQKNK